MDAQPSTTETRPCAHCGAPVPQRVGAGRPFRYCRDNDGACQRASRNSRMRHRNAPGLPGQVARTWEAVDRLDQIVETLTSLAWAGRTPRWTGSSWPARRRTRAAVCTALRA
ncbi:hypothetical protein AB0C20_09760, partial [Micromonospora sp. NPDC048843]